MHAASAAAEDVVTPTDRPAHSEDRTMRMNGGSMLVLADDLRADDRRDADARRAVRRPTSTMTADRRSAMAGARLTRRGASLMLAGLRRIAAISGQA